MVQRAAWKWYSQIFIVHFNFNTPNSTVFSVDVNDEWIRHIFSSLTLEGNGNYIHGSPGSLGSKKKYNFFCFLLLLASLLK